MWNILLSIPFHHMMDIDIEPTDKKNWTLPSGWSTQFNQHTAHNVCVWSLFQRFYNGSRQTILFSHICVWETYFVRKGIGLIRIESNRRGWMDQMAIFRQGARKYSIRRMLTKIFLFLKRGTKQQPNIRKGHVIRPVCCVVRMCTFSNKDNLLTKMNITTQYVFVCAEMKQSFLRRYIASHIWDLKINIPN